MGDKPVGVDGQTEPRPVPRSARRWPWFVVVALVASLLVGGPRPAAGATPTYGPGHVVLDQIVQADLLALDGSGNLFIADSTHHRVAEYPDALHGTGSQIPVPLPRYVDPVAMAMDQSGDLFFSINGVLTGIPPSIVEYVPTAGGYQGPVTILQFGANPTPTALAVDTAGDLFYLRGQGVGELVRLATGFSGPVTLPLSADAPAGLAVDPSGDLFVSDYPRGGLDELVHTTSGYGPQIVVPAPIGASALVAADGAGNVYTATQGSPAPVLEVAKTPTGFADAVGLDFRGYFAASIAADAAGDLFVSGAGTGFPSGIGVFLATSAGHGPQVPLDLGAADAGTIAVNRAGDLFIADAGSPGGEILEMMWGTAGYTKGPLIFDQNAGGIVGARAVAIDGEDNLYLLTAFGVDLLPRTADGYGPPTPVPLQLTEPNGYRDLVQQLAVDARGDVVVGYLDQSGDRRLAVLPRVGTGYGAQQTLSYRPRNLLLAGLVADDKGDVFVSDLSTVTEIPSTPSGYGAAVLVVSNATFPTGLALDPSGDLYFADSSTATVSEVALSNGSYGPPVVVANPEIATPVALAIDHGGDLFVGGYGTPNDTYASIEELPFRSVPPVPPGPPGPPTPPPCPSPAGPHLGSAVGVSAVTIGGCPGYDVVDSAGRVSSFGAAAWHGDLRGLRLDAPVIAITATADGGGYWLLGADGGVFSFGDATFHGSTGGFHLNAPVVAMAVTPDSRGYWVVARDGGVFSFGDATFHGSTGDLRLARPVDGIAAAPGGNGYWLVASDGGVFTFTPDGFYGSLGTVRLNRPVIGMSGTPDGRGYTLVASDGGVFTFGDASFYGSLGAHPPTSPIVDLGPTPAGDGYYMVDGAGTIYPFGPGAADYGSA